MSAIFYQKWNIDPSVNIEGLTADDVNNLWRASLGEIDTERRNLLLSQISDGNTESQKKLIEVDPVNRTMTRQREFVNAAEAQVWLDWLDEHVPAVGGGFSRVEQRIIEDSALETVGKFVI